jgi:hypothetical protein
MAPAVEENPPPGSPALSATADDVAESGGVKSKKQKEKEKKEREKQRKKEQVRVITFSRGLLTEAGKLTKSLS